MHIPLSIHQLRPWYHAEGEDAHIEQNRQDKRYVHDEPSKRPSKDEICRGQKQARRNDEKQEIHGVSGKSSAPGRPHPN